MVHSLSDRFAAGGGQSDLSKVVGKSVGLPGLLVLMAVTIGGEAFGILGMLFSVPVCAVLFSLYLEFMKKASTL